MSVWPHVTTLKSLKEFSHLFSDSKIIFWDIRSCRSLEVNRGTSMKQLYSGYSCFSAV
jgi:hypothetical protein